MAVRQTLGLLLAGMLVLLAGCSSGPQIKSFHDYNPAIDFARYQSWSYISDNPMIVSQAAGSVNPLLQTRIMQSIRMEMDRRGFRYVKDPEAADMAVSFTVGSREQIKVDQYPASYQMSYGRYYRGYGYGYGMGYGTETRVRQYTEGQLAIDIFDVTSHSPAFHGSATSRITSGDRDNPQPFLNAVVAEALMGFPPGFGQGNAVPELVPLEENK